MQEPLVGPPDQQLAPGAASQVAYRAYGQQQQQDRSRHLIHEVIVCLLGLLLVVGGLGCLCSDAWSSVSFVRHDLGIDISFHFTPFKATRCFGNTPCTTVYYNSAKIGKLGKVRASAGMACLGVLGIAATALVTFVAVVLQYYRHISSRLFTACGVLSLVSAFFMVAACSLFTAFTLDWHLLSYTKLSFGGAYIVAWIVAFLCFVWSIAHFSLYRKKVALEWIP